MPEAALLLGCARHVALREQTRRSCRQFRLDADARVADSSGRTGSRLRSRPSGPIRRGAAACTSRRCAEAKRLATICSSRIASPLDEDRSSVSSTAAAVGSREWMPKLACPCYLLTCTMTTSSTGLDRSAILAEQGPF